MQQLPAQAQAAHDAVAEAAGLAASFPVATLAGYPALPEGRPALIDAVGDVEPSPLSIALGEGKQVDLAVPRLLGLGAVQAG